MAFVDRYLERHITPVTLKSNIKRNPLFMDISSMDAVDKEKSKPSWTVKEYDTQTIHGNLAHYLKVLKGRTRRVAVCDPKFIRSLCAHQFLLAGLTVGKCGAKRQRLNLNTRLKHLTEGLNHVFKTWKASAHKEGLLSYRLSHSGDLKRNQQRPMRTGESRSTRWAP